MSMMLVLVLLFATALASSVTRQTSASPVSVFTFNQFVWIIVGGVFAVCLVVGFSIPCCLCVRQDDDRWRNAVVILYALSWFLPGLDVGSIALSWHSHRKNTPEWRTCSPVCSTMLGLFEFILVVVCFPLAAVLDCVLLPNFFVTNISSSGVPFFLLLLAIPGYFGALLFFGLPRVLTMFNATSTKRRDRALEIASVAADEVIVVDHVCNSCKNLTATKFCGSCGANNKCDTCDCFVVGPICSTCGVPLIPFVQVNPFAQQQQQEPIQQFVEPPPLPDSKPALPPKKKKVVAAAAARSDSFLSFPPESMQMWVVSVVFAALSLLVLALCAAQVTVAQNTSPALTQYSNPPPYGYGVQVGGAWYSTTCVGVFTGIVGLLVGLFGVLWLLSKHNLHRIAMFSFLAAVAFIAIFAFVVAIMCSVVFGQLNTPQPFLQGQSMYQSFQSSPSCAGGRCTAMAAFMTLIIVSAIFAFALTAVAIVLIVFTVREIKELFY